MIQVKGLVMTGMGGGGVYTKWENRGSKTFCAPPPPNRVKLFVPPPPLLKSGKVLRHPPFNMAKT